MTTPDNTNPEAAVPEGSEKAVTNPATQTLFRFVSLRNPQLTESKDNAGFITRPKLDIDPKGHFDLAIEAWAAQNPKTGTKFQALELAAASFEALKSEKDVRKVNTQYYDLGKSLSKNEDLDAKSPFEITDGSLAQLWDNLIYQVVTQKDFYVKEAIIQTLKAVHYADNNSDEATASQAKKAKVVLPAKLFVEDAPIEEEEEDEDQAFTVEKTVIGSHDQIAGGAHAAKLTQDSVPRSLSVAQESRLKVNAEKNLQVTKALLKKEMLQTLKKELEKLQKSYSKAYYKTYNNELATYQAGAQPIIERNNNLIDELEATFDDSTTEAAKKAAYEQLQLTEVPKFEFFYKKEINFTDLQAKLTPESFNMFLELFTEYDAEAIADGLTNRIPQNLNIISDTELSIYDTAVTLSEDYFSYLEIFSKLDEEISAESKTALSAVEMPKQQYVNLGGALVPVAKTSGAVPFSYLLQVSYIPVGWFKYYYLQFSFAVENESWSVATAKVSAETDKGAKEQTLYNLSVVDQRITFPALFLNQFSQILSLKIELYFDNGREAVLEFLDIVNDLSYPGIFDLKSLSGSNSAKPAFQPKHFGIKRLGIADYLKVEQSVHAYVPGEVSNIENVMASELRQKSSTAREYSEVTETTTKSQESEKISDTTKTSRTDMQTEVAKELDRQKSFEAHASFGRKGDWYFDVGGSYANSTAQHDSNRQAVAKSQEITERAMERVLTKVSEERVQKIIKEYTEKNVHEFDNRGKVTTAVGAAQVQPQHITGVYRWVDKKMKNQIYNYGKRTMFEFMIPEPSRLHTLATKAVKVQFTEPLNPTTQPAPNTMANANVDESIIRHWAEFYGVALESLLPDTNPVFFNASNVPQNDNDFLDSFNFEIPDNYAAKNANFDCGSTRNRGGGWDGARYSTVTCSDLKGGMIGDSYSDDIYFNKWSYDLTTPAGNVDFKVQGHNVKSYSIKVTVNCGLTEEYKTNWKQTGFSAIMAAYTKAKEKFDADVKAASEAAAAQEAENKEKKTNFYRVTESNIIKHNCIAYLLQNQFGYGALGQTMSEDDTKTMQSFHMLFGQRLDDYTALAKFMEQAFEWSVMDYTFYPYYWANGAHWQDLYLSEDMDELFRSFLQAGMARVIVTVKPGFEDAVQFFMTTGRIWNGGEVPVIGDPMYLSIVEELRAPLGKPQGNYWITRIPTTLTILQASSVGLPTEGATPLPIFPVKDPENCENPLELEFKTNFSLETAQMLHEYKESTLPTTVVNN